MVNLLTSDLKKRHHRYDQMLQFLCVDGSGDKEELIEVEYTQVNVSNRSGDGNSVRVAFMCI